MREVSFFNKKSITQQCHIGASAIENKQMIITLKLELISEGQNQTTTTERKFRKKNNGSARIDRNDNIHVRYRSFTPLHSTVKSAILSNVISSPMWFIIIQDVAFVVMPLGQ